MTLVRCFMVKQHQSSFDSWFPSSTIDHLYCHLLFAFLCLYRVHQLPSACICFALPPRLPSAILTSPSSFIASGNFAASVLPLSLPFNYVQRLRDCSLSCLALIFLFSPLPVASCCAPYVSRLAFSSLLPSPFPSLALGLRPLGPLGFQLSFFPC